MRQTRLHRIAVGGVFFAAALLLMVGSADTADTGMYIGASVGQLTLNVDDIGDDLEDFDFSGDSTAFKFFGGYRFLSFLSVEGGYRDLGSPDDSFGDLKVETGLTAWDLEAVGILPIGPIDLFAKAGILWWDADIKARLGDDSERDSDNGSDLLYGVGVALRLGSVAVRGELERFDIENTDDVYMWSLGATITF